MAVNKKAHNYRYTILLLLILFSSSVYSQCKFSITRSNINDHCLYAEEEVVWTSAAGIVITGNSIKKTIVSSNWDAGAISVNAIKNNGWATTVIDGINTDRMFGISATPSSVPSFGRSQFGIYLGSNGKFSIYESGNHRGNPAGDYTDNTYRINDVFKIWIDKGMVKYYQNNTLLLVSNANPTFPMVVDATLSSWSPAATISQVKISNGSDGTFMLTEANPGLGATFTWLVDGNPVGTGFSYNNPLLNTTNVLTCVLKTGGSGCAPVGTLVNSNAIRFQNIPKNRFGDYGVVNSATSFACFAAAEPAIFKDINNVEASNNDLVRVRGTSSWNAGAFSVNSIKNNGYVQATVTEITSSRLFGLSATNTGDGSGSVQFAFYIRGDHKLEIYEMASQKIGLGDYSSGDILKIENDNGIIKYYVNGVLQYISSLTPAPSLYADLAFEAVKSTLDDIIISNGTEGVFSTHILPAGSSPSYQWEQNGTPIPGATSSSYTYPTMGNGHHITCEIDPGLVGCASSATIPVNITSIPFKGTSYITSDAVTIACTETVEQVEFTDKVNVIINGNTISKFQGGGGLWNAGATSLNEVLNNGYAEMTIDEINSSKVFGLSAAGNVFTHTSSSEQTILYGIYFRSDAFVDIYELVGAVYTYRGNFTFGGAGISKDDVFRISIDQGTVRYSRNGVAFYSSAMLATAFLPLVVDISLNTAVATLKNLVISNGSSGIFNAKTANAGVAPMYQWKLNSGNDGTNSPSYSHIGLIPNDIIQCFVTPDIPGCSSSGYLSNSITVKTIGGTSLTTWTGTTSSAWDISSNWTNGVPKGFHNVFIPSGTPNSPAINLNSSGVYDLTIGNGALLSVLGSNSLTIFNDFNNLGILSSNLSTIELKTCTNNRNRITSTAPETFNNLVIENANGVDVSGEHHIRNQMSLNDGIIKYAGLTDLIVFDNDATVTGATDYSYVSGPVKKIGDEAFTFPIGRDGVYRKLSISNPGSTTDNFVAEYFKTDAKLSYGVPADASFWTVSGCEYWTLSRSGGSNVTVELSWNLAANCPNPPYITDPAQLRVTYWNGTIWADAGNALTSGGASDGTILSDASITNYNTAFTLASKTSANPLPITLVDFEARIISNGVKLSWSTLTEINSKQFIIERSDDGVSFTNIDSVDAKGNTNTRQEYSYVDRMNSYVRKYYRLKMVDFDGSYSFSALTTVKANTENIFSVYPNPVKRGEILYLSKESENGRIIHLINKTSISISNGLSFIDTTNLQPGIYLYYESRDHFQKLVVY